MSRLEELGVRESENEYVIEGIEDADVVELCFSYSISINFQGQEDRIFGLTLEMPFRFLVEDSVQEVDPEKLDTCHGLFQLHKDIVTSARVQKNGELRMAFKSGAELIAVAGDK